MVEYVYDAVNRVTAVKEYGSATNLATYSYDNLSRRRTLTYANGLVANYGYEGDSALDSLSHDFTGTADDVAYTFDYNLANQVTRKNTSNGAFLYNASVTLDAGYTVNGLNQYESVTQGSIA